MQNRTRINDHLHKGIASLMLDKRRGSLGKKRVKWNLCAREAYSDIM
ncbi:hypothetical protein HanPI659440_Chr10g0401491 [Helianthus annuus]|nr:hypothetical protein HanPI659440_Chr10g0401491 [Helianthus annuus]